MTKSSTDRTNAHREPQLVESGSAGGSEWTLEGELSAEALGETESDRYIVSVCQYTVSAHRDLCEFGWYRRKSKVLSHL